MPVNPFTISPRYINPGEPVTADVAGRPDRDLAGDIQTLWSALPQGVVGAGSGNPVTVAGVTVASNVTPWSVVFYNPGTAQYELAQAQQIYQINQSNLANTAAAAGIIIFKPSTTTGQLLVGGVQTVCAANTASLLEPGLSWVPGAVYYLSANFPGKLTSNKPSLAVQVLIAGPNFIQVLTGAGLSQQASSYLKTFVGMRPMGSIRTDPTTHITSVVAFDVLEDFGSGAVALTTDAYGWLQADASFNKPFPFPIWTKITVSNAGAIMVTSSLTSNFASTFNSNSAYAALSSGNHSTVRTYSLQDPSGNIYGTISFSFMSTYKSNACTWIAKCPDTFQGWKPITDPNSTQIFNYAADFGSSFGVPTDAAFYYNIKADPLLQAIYPSFPDDRAMFYQNGSELVIGAMLEDGATSSHPAKYDVGASRKTLNWASSNYLACPWDSRYQQVAAGNLLPTTCYLPTIDSTTFSWWEDAFNFEPYANRGWIYTSRPSVGQSQVGADLIFSGLVTSTSTGATQITPGNIPYGMVLREILLVVNNQTTVGGSPTSCTASIGVTSSAYADLIAATLTTLTAAQLYNKLTPTLPAGYVAAFTPVWINISVPASGSISVQTLQYIIKFTALGC